MRVFKLTLVALWCLVGAFALIMDLITDSTQRSFFAAYLQFCGYAVLFLIGIVAIKHIKNS